jgi:hypothetical protein
MSEIRTPEQVEADGVWVSAAHSGRSTSTLSYWIGQGLLQEGEDYQDERVARQLANGRLSNRLMRFFRRDALERVERERPSFSDLAKERWQRPGFRAKASQGMKDAWQRSGRKAEASAKRKAWWRNPVNRASAAETAKARSEESERLVEGKTVLLRLRLACKYLGICDKTLLAWSDTEDHHGSCPFLPGRAALCPETRDGRPYWALAQLKKVRRRRSKFRRTRAAAGTYTPEQTSELTGLSPTTLKHRKRRKALGLRITTVEVLVGYQRKAKPETEKGHKRGGKREWSRIKEEVVFTKDSVDRYVREHPPAARPADTLTPGEVADKLKVDLSTVYNWMHEGLLDGEPVPTEQATTTPRDLFRVTLSSTRTASKCLAQAGGDVRQAGRLLRQARKSAASSRPATLCNLQQNAAPQAVSASPLAEAVPSPPDEPIAVSPAAPQADGASPAAEPASKKRGRKSSAETEEVQKFCYERFIMGHKLARIQAAAAVEFAKRPGYPIPRTPGHVATLAHRYADRHGLPYHRPTSKNP